MTTPMLYCSFVALTLTAQVLAVEGDVIGAHSSATVVKPESQVSSAADPGGQGETITVYGTKIPGLGQTTTTYVSTFYRDDIEKKQADNIRALLNHLPGVNVPYQGSRFGLGGISIRGIGGNRVAMEVDGAPVATSFSIGSYTNASRDFLSLDLTRQLDLVRGPSSVLFGSDALGGVVATSTIDPDDMLQDGQNVSTRIKSRFASLDESSGVRATTATRLGDHGVLFSVSGKNQSQWQTESSLDRDEYENRAYSVFSKHVYGDASNGGLKSSLYFSSDDSDTSVASLERVQDFSGGFLGPVYLIETNEVIADDKKTQKRFVTGQFWQQGLSVFDTLRWQVYLQDFDTTQETTESRSLRTVDTISQSRRERLSTYDQGIMGLKLSASHKAGSSLVFYGLEYKATKTEQQRDGHQVDLATGERTHIVGPDIFPVRDFPVSTTENSGAFLQLQTHWFDERLRITPGLRYEHYRLRPESDSIFLEDNPGIVLADIEEDATSVSLGMDWKVDTRLSIYGQYAEGFRAPPMNSVNVGFTNLQFGYMAISNPDLVSETSAGYEAGLRWNTPRTTATLSLFKNDYDDFIEDFVVVGTRSVENVPFPVTVFQSRNLTRVETEGLEFMLKQDLGDWYRGLSLSLGGAYTEGESVDTDSRERIPLNSVDPLRVVASMAYAPYEHWGAELSISHAAKKKDIDNSNPERELFVPDAHTVANLTAYYALNDSLRFQLGLFNLMDETYFLWSDVKGRVANDPNLQQLINPGRHGVVSVQYAF